MRYLKVLIPVVLIAALGACAKPPQADIDAAKAAVAAAAQNADIVAYAADTLKTAQDELAQMQTELDAKHYDKVKSLAIEAKAAAETAANDAAKGKEKAQADATSLIESLKKALPEAQQRLAMAKKNRKLKLDFGAFAKQLQDAKTAFAGAQKDLDAGNFATALQTATTIQSQLSDGEKMIADALAALKK
jgi:Domain of unknown function (DUF4398)